MMICLVHFNQIQSNKNNKILAKSTVKMAQRNLLLQ